MIVKILQILSLLLFTAQAISSQNIKAVEAQLKQVFENQKIGLRVDMPADCSGIDFWPENPEKTNDTAIAKRIKDFKVSLSKGGRAYITKIKVDLKKIEFYLDGGGYVLRKIDPPAPTPKSPEEIELDAALQRELIKRPMNTVKVKSIKKRLAQLVFLREQQDRLNEQKYKRDIHNLLESSKQERLQKGSRFILRFQKTPITVTPEVLKGWLDKYADFAPPVEDFSAETSEDVPIKDPAGAEVRPYWGKWQSESGKGEGILIENGNFHFGSGTVIEYHESFRLMSERVFVIEAVRSWDGESRFIILKTGDSDMTLIFYDSMDDLQNGTKSKRKEVWKKR